MTTEELFEYFKIQANRPDWTMQDFVAAQTEAVNFLNEANRLVSLIGYWSSLTDASLQNTLNILSQVKQVVELEIARRE